MTIEYAAAVFVVAFTPLALAIGIVEFDRWRKVRADRRNARRDFQLIGQREAAKTALREPFRFSGRAM